MLLLVAMVVALVVGSGVALAKTINGNDRDNVLFGTERADTIRGFGGEDVIFGLDGGDTLIGERGQDEVFGGNGNDEIKAVDRSEDLIFCGPGRDRVRANPGDDLFGCERVVRDGRKVGEHNLGNWSNLLPFVLQEGSKDIADELERIEALEKEE
jgi:RTX calcium-binding nonapeptide repeat (4 copies)